MIESLNAERLYRSTRFEQDPRKQPCDITRYMQRVHPRAWQSLAFGLHLKRKQNHIFVLGEPGVGRIGMVKAMLEQAAASRAVPDDVVLVADFASRNQTRYLYFPAGRGRAFKEAVEAFIAQMKAQLPLIFDGVAYQRRSHELELELKARQDEVLKPAYELAEKLGVEIDQGDNSFMLYAKHEGQLYRLSELKAKDEALYQRYEKAIGEVEQALNEALSHFPQLQHAHQEAGRRLNTETALAHISPLIDKLQRRFGERQEVADYLDDLKHAVVARLHLFWDQSAEQVTTLTPQTGLEELIQAQPGMAVFGVNLLVDNGGLESAPVIYEDNITLAKLTGFTIQAHQQNSSGDMLALAMNHQAGLLQQAHGGFLMLPVEKVLADSALWTELKAALMGKRLSFTLPQSAQVVPYHLPDFPLEVTLVLIGEPAHFYALQALDSDFDRLFKVQVEFESELERTGEYEQALAARLADEVARWNDLPMSVCALERMVEYAARLAEDQQRLSANKGLLRDMMAEANAWARAHGHEQVTREVVEAAIEQRSFHTGLVEDAYHRAVVERQILIDLEGQRVGQVNGLTWIALGKHAFGQPVRITAQVSPGDQGVLDIEREVEMAGPIHSKGVLILDGFLRARYLRHRQDGFSASVVMEQTYDGVEGDSASSAELVALISALAQVPLRQDLALTGSVNQFGDMQPVGGINEKIEGFFKICRARGLTGEQGVILPRANVRHLMLSQAVRDAVAAGQFYLYAVGHVDDSLELLTGMRAQQVHDQVLERLERWAEKDEERADTD
ncbi:AAA family ATPase [Sulfurivirga sp.]|uniref:Lon protease family protein n=1 Tax=Sulfurivirga sp. TaxID=2614236 RepID=UPI0025E13374|nr:AAA family ATPase [Sulfurivirga sp.]